jgi:hypothetical protein
MIFLSEIFSAHTFISRKIGRVLRMDSPDKSKSNSGENYQSEQFQTSVFVLRAYSKQNSINSMNALL